MTRMFYKGYEIEAKPDRLVVSQRWKIRISILRYKGNQVTEKPFEAGHTFGTEEEAKKYCLDFGMKIIDGQINDCSVDDL